MLKGEGYCISAENILSHEMIGLNVKVQSNDMNKNTIKGLVVDETKNTFVVETNSGEKIVPKNECVFGFQLGKDVAMVDGKKILYRPEQRLKALIRRNAL